MKVYADGGCKPNPGTMAVAVVTENNEVWFSQLLGNGTNNIAEYLAVQMAAVEAWGKNIQQFTMCIDSILVLQQLTGKWKCRDTELQPHMRAALAELQKLEKVNIVLVGGDANRAHYEVERLLAGVEITGTFGRNKEGA